MCRGCGININGKAATYEYLEWLNDYHSVVWAMQKLNKKILDFENKLDDDHQKKIVSRFRRRLIGLRKKIGKADDILNGV